MVFCGKIKNDHCVVEGNVSVCIYDLTDELLAS